MLRSVNQDKQHEVDVTILSLNQSSFSERVRKTTVNSAWWQMFYLASLHVLNNILQSWISWIRSWDSSPLSLRQLLEAPKEPQWAAFKTMVPVPFWDRHLGRIVWSSDNIERFKYRIEQTPKKQLVQWSQALLDSPCMMSQYPVLPQWHNCA